MLFYMSLVCVRLCVCMCVDIDECADAAAGGTAGGPCSRGFQCINTDGSYHCQRHCVTSSDDRSLLSDAPELCPPIPSAPRHGLSTSLSVYTVSQKCTNFETV